DGDDRRLLALAVPAEPSTPNDDAAVDVADAVERATPGQRFEEADRRGGPAPVGVEGAAVQVDADADRGVSMPRPSQDADVAAEAGGRRRPRDRVAVLGGRRRSDGLQERRVAVALEVVLKRLDGAEADGHRLGQVPPGRVEEDLPDLVGE